MARVFGSLKIRKDGTIIGSYRSSNSIFSLSTVLISSLKMSIKSLTFLEGNPFRKTLLLDMIQIFDCLKKIPKCVNNSESYRFSILFSVFTALIPTVNVSIVNSDFVEKYFNEKLLFSPVAWIFDCPKVPKDANNIGLSQSSNSSFSLTAVLISSLKISIKTFF